MSNKLKRIFSPTPEEKIENQKRFLTLHKELAKKKGCSTCGNIRQVIRYPGFVTGEECECTAGLECDTVLFSVENFPRWTDALQTK